MLATHETFPVTHHCTVYDVYFRVVDHFILRHDLSAHHHLPICVHVSLCARAHKRVIVER